MVDNVRNARAVQVEAIQVNKFYVRAFNSPLMFELGEFSASCFRNLSWILPYV